MRASNWQRTVFLATVRVRSDYRRVSRVRLLRRLVSLDVWYHCAFLCADNQSASLIFSSRHEIRMIDLSQPHIQPILVPSLRNTIAIDFLQDAGEYGKQLVFPLLVHIRQINTPINKVSIQISLTYLISESTMPNEK